MGRVTRATYWGWSFGGLVPIFVASAINEDFGAFTMMLYYILMFVLGIGRMHDADHSGWWIFVPIVSLIFTLQDGTAGRNRFGPDPKGRNSGRPVPSTTQQSDPKLLKSELDEATRVPARATGVDLEPPATGCAPAPAVSLDGQRALPSPSTVAAPPARVAQ